MFFLGRKTLSLIIHFLMLNESIIGRPELETPLEVSFVCSDLLEYMQLLTLDIYPCPMQVIILLNFLMNSATTCIYALSESLLEEVWTQLEKCHAPPFKWSLKYVPNVDFYQYLN